MEFTTHLNQDDLIRFTKISRARTHSTPKMKRQIIMFSFIYWCFLTMFLTLIYHFYKHSCCDSYNRLYAAMVTFAIWFIVSSIWPRIHNKSYISESTNTSGTVLGHWTIDMSDQGITESNTICSYTHQWEAFRAIEKDQHNFYLFTDNARAIILPLSQINDEIELFIRDKVPKTTK